MSTIRVVDPDVLLPAAEALSTVAEQLDGAADEVEGAGRTALSGAGQFTGELSEGAAVLSLSWSAAARLAGRSATTLAAVAVQAVTTFDALDAQAAAGVGGVARPR